MNQVLMSAVTGISLQSHIPDNSYLHAFYLFSIVGFN